MKAKDNLGQEIKVGDVIAYATIIGRSANQSVYVVDDVIEWQDKVWDWTFRAYNTVTKFKLKATPLLRSYGNHRANRQTTLSMLERALVLPPHYRNLIEKENDND